MKFMQFDGDIKEHDFVKDGKRNLTIKTQPSGESVKVEKVYIDDKVYPGIKVGNSGRFVILKRDGYRELIGARIGKKEYIAPDVYRLEGGNTRTALYLFFGGLCTLSVILAIIGIPLLFYGIRDLLKNPGIPKKLQSELQSRGFVVAPEPRRV